jgi:hypothetical protein
MSKAMLGMALSLEIESGDIFKYSFNTQNSTGS